MTGKTNYTNHFYNGRNHNLKFNPYSFQFNFHIIDMELKNNKYIMKK